MIPTKADRKLPRCLHIRRSSDFSRNRRAGSRARTAHFVVCASPGPDGLTRLGLVVGRKVGTAVLRNSVKRRIREIFRQHRASMPGSSDLVIVALPGAAVLGYEEIEREILGCLSRMAGSRATRPRTPE